MKLISPRPTARLAALAMACLISVGHASNFGFLESAPAGNFDDKDWELLQNAVTELLDTAADGGTGAWRNEQNGHNGRLVLSNNPDHGTTATMLIPRTQQASNQ